MEEQEVEVEIPPTDLEAQLFSGETESGPSSIRIRRFCVQVHSLTSGESFGKSSQVS
jgi:hypothetical protein